MSTQNELSLASKVADLLIHDTECSITRSGVCTCKFYDVADRIIELIKLELADARKEVIDSIDSFDVVEPCVPDCTPEQHAFHEGTWSAHLKLEKILATLKEEEK